MSTPISQAIDSAGGQRALAARLKVHPALVSQWATGRRPVAAHHVRAIEEATGVSRHALRPDVFGPAPSETAGTMFSIQRLGLTKRALRSKLGLANDAGLAVVLRQPREVVAGWGEDAPLPALPAVVALLGESAPAAVPAAPVDPEADRIVPVESA